MLWWPSCSRRVALAVVAVLGLLGAGLEPLLPDTHDGDAAISIGTSPARSAPEQSTPAPQHQPDAPHVCHCAHVHAVELTAAATSDDAPDRVVGIPPFHSGAPVTAPRAPHFRPPIA